MIDALIWVGACLVGYCLGANRNRDTVERLEKERSRGYTEGVCATINAMSKITKRMILKELGVKNE